MRKIASDKEQAKHQGTFDGFHNYPCDPKQWRNKNRQVYIKAWQKEYDKNLAMHKRDEN